MTADLLGFDFNETECGEPGDECESCCSDCFRLLDGHCDECGTCWCDGADTGECQDAGEAEDHVQQNDCPDLRDTADEAYAYLTGSTVGGAA
jgi:hypothetical protein